MAPPDRRSFEKNGVGDLTDQGISSARQTRERFHFDTNRGVANVCRSR
jgi:hypothetical protein